MPATTNEAGARGSDESAGVLISSDTFHCCNTLHTTQSSAAGGGGEECRAGDKGPQSVTIMEKAPSPSWLKAPSSTFTFKNY